MEPDRIKLLEQFTREEPGDPFNWYALALEETKWNPTRAADLFEYVLKNHPDYLATYYHAGNLFLSLNNLPRAKQILEAGAELAKKQGQHKALRELMAVLDELAD